ncbi:flagellar motor switch protein FliN [Candidatus Dependentiae bacterium]|nr:flagellar motor switch protein FliN [Candidatus Dependentiae bacterium]
MGGGLLSQDDINAMLTGLDDIEQTASAMGGGTTEEPTPEKSISLDHLTKVFNYFNDAGKSVLSTIIGTDVESRVVSVKQSYWKNVRAQMSGMKVVLSSKFNEGFSGDFKVFVDNIFGGVLADLMTGSDGSVPPETLTELHESAINEAINQMIASGLTGISGELKKISLSTEVPQVKVADINEQYEDDILSGKESIVAEYRFDIINYKDKPVFFVFPLETAENINEKFSGGKPKQEEVKSQNASAVQQSSSHHPESVLQKENPVTSQKNMFLLLDVPIRLSVNLGKTKLLMKDILNLGIGSIIELDKAFNEPVDLAAGTKPIARGEVVVVDENFGLRVTELVTPLERLELIKKDR